VRCMRLQKADSGATVSASRCQTASVSQVGPLGDWCSGNTAVSKTATRGSIPRSPASGKPRRFGAFRFAEPIAGSPREHERSETIETMLLRAPHSTRLCSVGRRRLCLVLLLLATGLAACGEAPVEPAGRRYRVQAIADNGIGTTVVTADEGAGGKLSNGQITVLDGERIPPPRSTLWHYDAAFIRAHCPCTVETTGNSHEVRIVRELRRAAPARLPPLPVAIKLPPYVKRLPHERPKQP
jgi:hypothetical protein